MCLCALTSCYICFISISITPALLRIVLYYDSQIDIVISGCAMVMPGSMIY